MKTPRCGLRLAVSATVALAAVVSSDVLWLAPARGGEVRMLSPSQRAVVGRTQSFGLGRYPLSFWSYTNLREHGRYMDEAEVEEWADAGFTVPQSPSFDPSDPEQVAHLRRILDWCQARGMKLIVSDPRCSARWVDQAGKLVVPGDYAEGVRSAVALLGDHPARVMFTPAPLGGGETFAPDGLVSRLSPDTVPLLLSEFMDLDGRRYVMLVNLSMTESHQVGLTFPGKTARVFSWNWQGQEYEGAAYCECGSSRDEQGLTIRHFLAPGQEAVYRVEPAAAP